MPADTVVAGVPAKPLKKIDEQKKIRILESGFLFVSGVKYND
ncbi:hypothetical protein SAMN05216235_2429 [Salinicoccus halodurans]|uniref:Uncharacterized protein n=2 Tax=Salinicoccus halodurans TaxID=407035 RepID=A0AA94HHJ5_9STAP|nr:hypothetical protein SAMN05216235_2429 [Salinicoccus halodurans]